MNHEFKKLFQVLCMSSLYFCCVFLYPSEISRESHFSPSSYSLSLDINEDWQLIPEGGSPIQVDMPCFYVWKTFAAGYFDFGDKENGPWKILEGFPEATYRKILQIPGSFANYRILLHFQGVNYVADFYLNNQLIGSHMGGYLPFDLDISPYVNPPTSDTLEVKIRYWDSRFLSYNYIGDPDALPFWPKGFFGQYWHMGIIDTVSLVGINPVIIKDIFIKTSVQNSTIEVDFAVENFDSINHTINLNLDITHDGSQVKSLGSHVLLLEPGEVDSISTVQSWTDPVFWSPGNPYLYELTAEAREANVIIDQKKERFGFREFWIEGTRFVLNGFYYNLRGDNIVIHSENRYLQYLVPDFNNWSTILDSLISLNFNVIRFHQSPPPEWMIDLCDEKGMFVVAESAIYGDAPYRSWTYTNNSNLWLKEWVIGLRNHPSIIIWSAENEQREVIRDLSDTQVQSFGDTIAQLDDTRPLIFDGDRDLSGYASIYSYHYLYGILIFTWPAGGIYEMRTFVNSRKPTSWGEFEWSRGEKIPRSEWVRRQCVKTRAGRILGVADIRPYRLDWSWHPNPDFYLSEYGWSPNPEEITFLENTMNPVAVFDKGYYEFDPMAVPPEYFEYTLVKRDLVIFNDEESDNDVEVEWRVVLDGNIESYGTFTVNVPVATHIEKQISFYTPYVPVEKIFQLVLISRKNGIEKFRDHYDYISKDRGLGPPVRITDLDVEESNQYARLFWSTEDNNIVQYLVYRSTHSGFPGNKTDIVDGINETFFVDTLTGVIGDPDLDYYYQVRAINTRGDTSDYSNIVGVLDFHLLSHFNGIGLSLEQSDVITANDLLNKVPDCRSVAVWDPDYQGYKQYLPSLSFTDFPVMNGYPYYVNITSDTLFTLFGGLTSPTFDLITTNTTNFNGIILPLDRNDLTWASELCGDIPHCTGVAFWDAGIQGYVQYDPGIPSSDFEVRVGYPYLVHVTQSGQWPTGGMRRNLERIVINSNQEGLSEPEGSHAPHLVWGHLESDKLQAGGTFGYRAYIIGRAGEVLTDHSPGCSLKEGIWMVQCAGFSSVWYSGEWLRVEFEDQESRVVFIAEVTLSYHASDSFLGSQIENENGVLKAYRLMKIYPNPFNPETTIQYCINRRDRVKIEVFNLVGHRIQSLVNKIQEPGKYEVKWNGLDHRGQIQANGLYFIVLKDGHSVDSRKCVLLK